jgi:sigma-B regulation protein RsbU (phosphoserine phosphatase)
MYIDNFGLTETKIIIERIITLIFLAAIVKLLYDYFANKNYQNILFILAVVFRIFGGYAFVRYTDVNDVYNFLGHIYIIAAYFIFFKITFIHNVRQPYMQLEMADKKLKEHAMNLDRLVNERTNELKVLNHKLLEDLEYARDIQRAMLPDVLPENENVSFYSEYFPLERVGGDFYNVFRLDDDNIGMYIGDVSGHGVSAAMLTVFINQCIATVKEDGTGGNSILNPSMVLKKVYEAFNRINFKEDVYLILIYAVYNEVTRQLVFSSAGHNVPPAIIGEDGEVKHIEIYGFPICKFSEYYSANYVDSTLILKPGEKLLFYTDGICEILDCEGKRNQGSKLDDLLKENCRLSAPLLGQKLTKEIFNSVEVSEMKDDLTFFIMEIKS